MNYETKFILVLIAIIVIVLLILWYMGIFKKEKSNSLNFLDFIHLSLDNSGNFRSPFDFTASELDIVGIHVTRPDNGKEYNNNDVLMVIKRQLGVLQNENEENMVIDALWNHARNKALLTDSDANSKFTAEQKNKFYHYIKQGGVANSSPIARFYSPQVKLFAAFKAADFAVGGPAENWDKERGTFKRDQFDFRPESLGIQGQEVTLDDGYNYNNLPIVVSITDPTSDVNFKEKVITGMWNHARNKALNADSNANSKFTQEQKNKFLSLIHI